MPLANKRYIYLAGKIKLGHGATEYRGTVAPILLKHGIHSLDPLRGKYTMTEWNSLENNEVVVRDLQDIERSHIVLAVLMKSEEASIGTPCEIMYAWERRIPVILITNDAYTASHFWTKTLCSHIFFIDEAHGESFDETLLQAAEHIGHWYGDAVECEVLGSPKLAQVVASTDEVSPSVDEDGCCTNCENPIGGCHCGGSCAEDSQ